MAIAEIIGSILGASALGIAGLEWQYRRRPGNNLDLTLGEWKLELSDTKRYVLVGEMIFYNRTKQLEIMLPEVSAEVKLLSQGNLAGITCRTKIIPMHSDAPGRSDDYWFGYIVKIGKTTQMKICVEIEGEDLSQLQTAWVKVNYITYGPEGRIPKERHVVIPLSYPDNQDKSNWRQMNGVEVLPIRTHLLSHLDDPVEIVKRYVLPYAKTGDIVSIGETPIAIMQGRWFHPNQIKPGIVAKRLCYFFMPTSSLATACGLQALVDIVGPVRVVTAFVLGSIAKIFGKPGVFYQLAGEQARLIDDVTGTLPPYDQFIVLGPQKPQQVVNEIKNATGLSAAIVDVNDLKAVKILAANSDVSYTILEQALRSNPAGNADEQTPIVLIRPV